MINLIYYNNFLNALRIRMRQNNIVKKALDKIDQGPLIYKTLLFKMYQEILLATTAYNRKRVFHPIIASHCMLYILITVTIDVNRTIVDIFSSLTFRRRNTSVN